MNSDHSHIDVPGAPPTLLQRCRLLGLPVWQVDVTGGAAIVSGVPSNADEGDDPAHLWLVALGRSIASTATNAATGDEAITIVAPFVGCRLVVVREDGDPAGLVVIGILGPDAFTGPTFSSLCADADVSDESARVALAEIPQYGEIDADRLATTLAWMGRDVARVRDSDQTVTKFSGQLVESYEQISLLYKLGRSMSRLSEPGEFLETTCTLLNDLLEFRWTAARLRRPRSLTVGLDLCTVAGTLGCDPTEFERVSGDVVDSISDDNWTVLLERDHSPLAALTDSQVVVEPIVSGGRVVGALMTGNKRGPDPEVTSIETQLLDAAADFLGAFFQNVKMLDEQRTLFIGSVQALTAAIDAKDRYTRGHSERVALLGSMLAAAIELDDTTVERVRIAGLVHDVGKIGVPESVLGKTGRLTDAEFDEIKRHPVTGYNILKDIPQLDDVLPGVLYHHERWDGRGYPEGLAGDDIPFLGRLLAVADAFDAMSSNRAYRAAMPRRQVLEEMERCVGTQFDPSLVPAFLQLDLQSYDDLVRQHSVMDAAA